MRNTIDNYQPNNKLFKYLLLAVLSVVACIYYFAFRLRDVNHFEWYDWFTCGSLAASAIYSYFNARRFEY